MTGHEKFKRGDRVRLSWAGLKHFEALGRDKLNAATRATVIGFGRKPHIVKIIRDGTRTISAFNVSYWEVDPQLPLPGVDVFSTMTPTTNPFTGRADGSAHTVKLYNAQGDCIGGGISVRYRQQKPPERA